MEHINVQHTGETNGTNEMIMTEDEGVNMPGEEEEELSIRTFPDLMKPQNQI